MDAVRAVAQGERERRNEQARRAETKRRTAAMARQQAMAARLRAFLGPLRGTVKVRVMRGEGDGYRLFAFYDWLAWEFEPMPFSEGWHCTPWYLNGEPVWIAERKPSYIVADYTTLAYVLTTVSDTLNGVSDE